MFFIIGNVLGSNFEQKDDEMRAIKQSRSLIRILSILFAIAGFNITLMAEARTLKFGHYADSDFTVGKTARQFANFVNKRTKGRLKIDLYPRAQLGSARTMFNATQKGSLDITLAPAIYLRDVAPKMDILELPFLFRNYKDVDRIFGAGNNIGQQLLEELKRANMKGLAFWEVGFRHISTSRRPIKGPWDLKGLRIRTYSNQALIQAFRLLGANPVSMPYGELFHALQMGVLDAQEGSIDTFYRFKLYETQRYLSLTRHSYTALVLVMNWNKFISLPRQEQKYVLGITERPESSNVGCETYSTNKADSTNKAHTTG